MILSDPKRLWMGSKIPMTSENKFLRPGWVDCKTVGIKYLDLVLNCGINGCCAESDLVRVSRS